MGGYTESLREAMSAAECICAEQTTGVQPFRCNYDMDSKASCHITPFELECFPKV